MQQVRSTSGSFEAPARAASDPPFARVIPWLLWLYWTALAGLACPYQDTVRDVAAALGIAEGSAWPSTGPGLAFSAHLGPLWFYLLAPAAAASSSWLGVAVLIAALAALKFPLAYRLGLRLCDWRFGLLFALALLLPGWQHLQSLLPTHTSLVETAVLAVLLLLLGYLQRPSPARAFALGLAFALALHAHPTTLVLAPIGVLAVWRYGTVSAWRPRLLSLMVAAALLPFLPYLLAQAREDWPDAGGAAAYVARSTGFRQLGNLPALAAALVWNGPRTLADALLPPGVRIAVFAGWVAVLLVPIAAAGAAWPRCPAANRRLIGGTLLVYVVTLSTLCLLRERVPWYMAYAPTLASAAVLAALWRGLIARWPAVTPLVAVAAVVCAASGLALDAGLWRQSARGEFLLPAGAMHDTLQGYEPPAQPPAVSGTSLAARFAAASGRFLCGHADAVLHASYGAYVDNTGALDQRLQCPRSSPAALRIGAGADILLERHWLGLPRRLWRALGREPDDWIGPFGLAHVIAVADAGLTAPVASADRYPPRDLLPPGDAPFTAELGLPAGAPLVTSVILGAIGPARVDAVEANGVAQTALAATAFVAVYRCADCTPPQPVHWRVRFRAARADLVDLAGLPPAQR